jgi:hypothetical protein
MEAILKQAWACPSEAFQKARIVKLANKRELSGAETAHQRRGETDRSEYREAAGVAEGLFIEGS